MVTVLTQRRRPTGEELAACPQITLSAEVAGLLHDVRSAPTSTPHPHRVIIPYSFFLFSLRQPTCVVSLSVTITPHLLYAKMRPSLLQHVSHEE